MGRAPCCEKVGLRKGRWTEQEDQILTDYIRANGEGSWRSLPKNAGTYLATLPIYNVLYFVLYIYIGNIYCSDLLYILGF